MRVVGSAPYVEPTVELAKKNISLIFDLADAHGLDLVDFHLDYNLDPMAEPLIYEVIAQATRRYRIRRPNSASQEQHGSADVDAPKRSCPRITIGHATRLQLFTPEEWRALAAAAVGIPLSLVGLPQSDMYMQGRDATAEPLGAPRGTLRVPYLAREHGIDVAMAVNNIANAFTPQGSLDPLTLCTFGVGVFQAATAEDVWTLAVCLFPLMAIIHPGHLSLSCLFNLRCKIASAVPVALSEGSSADHLRSLAIGQRYRQTCDWTPGRGGPR